MAMLPTKREADRVRRDIDRFFDRFVGEWPRFIKEPFEALGFAEGGWMPEVDVSETDKELIVRAELPGIEPNNVDVTIMGHTLTVSGKKERVDERKDERFHFVERSWGEFRRTIDLPAEVDTDRVQATYDKGVLKITMPKTEAAKTKKIPIVQ